MLIYYLYLNLFVSQTTIFAEIKQLSSKSIYFKQYTIMPYIPKATKLLYKLNIKTSEKYFNLLKEVPLILFLKFIWMKIYFLA